MNDLSPFGFRVRFHIPQNQIIDYEGESFDIQFINKEKILQLISTSETCINKSNNLVIKGGGFTSKEEALTVGLRVKKTLLLCGPFLDMGFDVGEDKASFILAACFKEEIKKFGYNAIDDVHGLNVFSEALPVHIFSSESKMKSYPSFNIFVGRFNKLYERDPQLSDKQTLALELFNLSYFEESLRAIFLTLMTGIECLSHPRKESIYKSCQSIIKKTLGSEFLKEFEIFYKIRNSLIHDGIVPGGIQLGSQIPKLRKFLSQLIIKLIPD